MNASDPIFENRNTALARAVKNGHDKCVELLLKAEANVETDFDCEPVLMLAARKGHARCVDLLIKGGADVNLVFRWFSPFTEAAKYGNDGCLDVLIEAGSDHVDITSRFGSLALGLAASKGHRKCVKSILGASVNDLGEKPGLQKEKTLKTINEALILVAENGHSTCITTLIEAGADVNYSSAIKQTPLINAIANDHLECVNYLIDAGADVNIQDNQKESPLSSATNTQSLKCLQLLLKRGAPVNMTSNNGQNALQYLMQRPFIRKNLLPCCFLQLRRCWDEIRLKDQRIVQVSCCIFVQPTLCLTDICPKFIRHYLLQVDPHTNLFQRVPRLGLTSILRSYLLFDLSLDDDSLDDGDDDIMAADGVVRGYDDLHGHGVDRDDDDNESIFSYLTVPRY